MVTRITGICGHPECQPDPLPAVGGTKTIIETGQKLKACRKHRSAINKANARFIGTCQWARYSMIQCTRTAITMKPLPGVADGEEIAVCRQHNSVANEIYAGGRNR